MRSVFDQVRRQTLTSPPSNRAADFLENCEILKVCEIVKFNFGILPAEGSHFTRSGIIFYPLRDHILPVQGSIRRLPV